MSEKKFYQDVARAEWSRARRRGIIDRLRDRLHDRKLVPYEAVRSLLRLRQCTYLGVQQVPVSQIVGSAGRYNDFTTSFLPVTDHLRQRWQRVSAVTYQNGLQPVQLVKVADAYFVFDGNHRVSIAHLRGVDAIEAEVWEARTDIASDGPSFAERLLHCWWLEACHESILADFGLTPAASCRT